MMRADLVAVLVGGLLLVGCSDDDGAGPTPAATTAVTTATTVTTTTSTPRPAGPVADVSEVLEGGAGPFVANARPVALPAGFVEEERVASGTAVSYRAEGELPADGRFALAESGSADYRTRVLIRRPEDAADFNGSVVVEWLNVSGGVDSGPELSFSADELARGGYAWVGVSAQLIGVEGGPVAVAVEGGAGLAGVGLRAIDPERYDGLRHPGDAFAYDIYTQVARALRAGDGLDDLRVERLLAVGESQSAFALTTYADGVQPLTEAFDGFLIHSRGAAAMPLGEPGQSLDIVSTIGQPPTVIRTDVGGPVLVVETETDLVSFFGYVQARQDDTDRFRLWEMAGTSHADRFLVGGSRADSLDCGGPINAGPQRFIIPAALRALDRWVRTGEAPAPAPRLEVDGTALRRDADGIALGGIRTPQVDVPVDVLSGEPRRADSVICLLLGSTTPMPADELAARYGTADAYLEAYTAAADATIAAGYVLPEDRDALLADAQPDRINDG